MVVFLWLLLAVEFKKVVLVDQSCGEVDGRPVKVTLRFFTYF